MVRAVESSLGFAVSLTGMCVRIREWKSFSNIARTDDLRLSHWTKASVDPEAGMYVINDAPTQRYSPILLLNQCRIFLCQV